MLEIESGLPKLVCTGKNTGIYLKVFEPITIDIVTTEHIVIRSTFRTHSELTKSEQRSSEIRWIDKKPTAHSPLK